MARIQYDIIPSSGGWSITCNDAPGLVFRSQSDAVKDTLSVAQQLRDRGETVSVRLLELDGPRRVWRNLEPRDAHLFKSSD
jgi:hypothetical protein